MKNVKLLNIDWLTLSCSGGLESNDPNLVVERQYLDNGAPRTSRQYGNLSKIYYKNQLIATTESEPHSQIIPANNVRVKIENRILYLRNTKNIVQNMLNALDLKFNQISRLDVAMDFQKFDNGLNPENLIRRFVKNEYVKVGRGKFAIIGSQKVVQHRFEYMRWGSKSTGKQMYLYNKTNEFKETKDKRYIRELWEMEGLTGKDVWRLELSITGNQQKATDTSTGEFKNINLFKIFSPDFLEELFMSGVNTLFSFRVNNQGKNISRMKELKLFKDDEFCTRKLVKVVDAPNATRYQRGVISSLIKDLHHVPLDNFNLLQQQVNTIWHRAILYDLRDYALEKVGYHFPQEEELILQAFKLATENYITDMDVLFESLRPDSHQASFKTNASI